MQWGAPPDVIALERARQVQLSKEAMVRVMPENWHALRVFIGMARQWHWVVGMAGARRISLRYEALPQELAAIKPTLPPQTRQPYAKLFEQLQELESAALEAMAQET